MTPSGWTLSGRLVRSLSVGLSFCWILGAGLASLAVRYELNEVFDSVLQETAQHLLPEILNQQSELLDAPAAHAAPGSLPAIPHDEYITYQILTASGTVRLRSHQAPADAYILPVATGFSWNALGQRIYTELSVDGRHAIQIAEPAGHRREAVLFTILLLLLPLAGLLPVAVWLVRRSVRKGLRPIKLLEAELSARGGANLSPLPVSALPEELSRLVMDMNLMLRRLAQTLDNERSFARNSAHELRTPVAAALVQTQLLGMHLGEATPLGQRALGIAAELKRLGRVAERLLQLSRAEGGAAMARELVDLVALARLLFEEFAPLPEVAGRLRFETGGLASLFVRGDVDAFGIALRNLLENAARHGDAAEPITLRLGPGLGISVTNGAPVIAPEVLARLKQPFERLDHATAGTGLGLAITETIMRQAGGTLRLASPPPGQASGFEATLSFPPP
ncbi:HAMP domain-containing sensor histidine kinase [Sediminicoccus sp. KRV36]|uniref:sensor histidine kinase n=1 Tax=Sediminicoccus sp. KRV36 TaxID=3133721 RepID=UPI00200BBB55|nr:HAMP domain-containing sensor histidine kinase [Sediminicoccus rosea]UPY38933.1 HAMP domain-containing histidine kinase [Sediminicoccus rosea]